MNQDSYHAESVPSLALGARVSEAKPTPPTIPGQHEGVANPPAPSIAYARTNDHLPPSSQPNLVIPSAGLIARNFDGALKRLDAERLAQVSDLGITEKDAADPRRILGQ